MYPKCNKAYGIPRVCAIMVWHAISRFFYQYLVLDKFLGEAFMILFTQLCLLVAVILGSYPEAVWRLALEPENGSLTVNRIKWFHTWPRTVNLPDRSSCCLLKYFIPCSIEGIAPVSSSLGHWLNGTTVSYHFVAMNQTNFEETTIMLSCFNFSDR